MLTGGLKNKIPSAGSSEISKLLNNKTVQSLTNGMSKQAQQAVNTLLGKASSVLGSSISSLATSFPSQSALFGDVKADSGTVASISKDKTYGIKETDSKMKTFSSDSSEAMSQPISFVTKPISDVIGGTSTTASGKKKTDMLSGMDSFDISKLSSGAGFDIISSSDVTRAVQQVTNTISSHFGTSSGFSRSSSSNSRGGSGSLLSSITKTLGSFTGGGQISSVLQSGVDMASRAYNALPASLKQQIGGNSSSTLMKAASALLTDRSSSYGNILGKLGNTSYSPSLQNRTVNLGGSYRYDGLTSEDGMPLQGYGNESSADINGLYAAATSICPGVSRANYVNYRQNKDLFDILMQLAAELGLSDLMRQMNKCSNGGTYFDRRTTTMLQRSSYGVAYNGDVGMYDTLTDILGPQNMPRSKSNLRILNANMNGSRANTTAYNRTLQRYGYDTEDLIQDEYYGRPVYSGRNTTLMSSSNTNVLDAAIGAGVRTLITGAFSAYS